MDQRAVYKREPQTISKLRKEIEKSIRASTQAMGIANGTVWKNSWEEWKALVYQQPHSEQVSWRKQQQLMTETLWERWRTQTQQSVTSLHHHLHRAGQNHTSAVTRSGGSVMAWTCMAASGMESPIFIDDGAHSGCSWMNSNSIETSCLPDLSHLKELNQAARQWPKNTLTTQQRI